LSSYGPGIDTDKSPARRLLEFMHAHFPEIAFVVCGNTTAIMKKQEGHPLSFIEGTRVVPFGIIELVKRQAAGWAYIRP
jgi:intracellular sulfur oxidation DsrE/DsrF family protein